MSVVDLKNAEDTKLFGGKSANLAHMLQGDLPVPAGCAVGLDAFEGNRLSDDAKQQIKQYLKTDKLYAVRSSALAEDAEGASWAGQFETFLDTEPEDVIDRIELCHNSAKKRAKAYAKGKTYASSFDIAVAVQEMVKPEYAGVLFTRDPISGENSLVTEYIKGLGEDLVSGRADPERVVLADSTKVPFNAQELADLATKVEKLFGAPQDIEWAWADNKMWLVQARPITTHQKARVGYYLGEPSDLFYWGPSRTQPKYMSDWLAATGKVFIQMTEDPSLPTPPRTLVLFHDSKMVYLSNAEDFQKWCMASFIAYKNRNLINADQNEWRRLTATLKNLDAKKVLPALISAWDKTIFAEFALYGAESYIADRLSRFDSKARQEIWGAFTVPDNLTFLARIDAELAVSKDPVAMAEKYPWVEDGYAGVSANAKEYFTKRLKIVGNVSDAVQDNTEKRAELTHTRLLSQEEVEALTLARQLAEFMDDRKAWMMQTRRLINQSANNIEHGWFFSDGKTASLDSQDAHELWERYVDFKTSSSAVVGIVASNGGRHFVNGEIAIVDSPTDLVDEGKIIVVPSTSPSYVPLMRKAKALITDHGGMMSHAAIVAREFNLPCIVGTKQATKVLKDGEKVVLDLVKGEVNK